MGAVETPGQGPEGQQGQPRPEAQEAAGQRLGEGETAGHTDEQQGDRSHGGKDDPGKGAPLGMDPAPKHLTAAFMVFHGGEDLESCPTGTVDFHVKRAPAGIGLVLPAHRVQALQHAPEKGHPVQALLGPVEQHAEGVLPVLQAEGFQGFPRAEGTLPVEQVAPVTGPASDDGLEEKQHRDQGPRPEAKAVPGEICLLRRSHAETEREQEADQSQGPDKGDHGTDHQQRGGHQGMVLEAGADDQRQAGVAGVDALEGRAAEHPMVDDRPACLDPDLGRGVDAAVPHRAAKPVEVFRMTAFQQGLCLAIAALLLEVGPDGVAPVVPDEAGRAEPDAVAALLEPPADVHVVARAPVDGVEPADLLQRPPVEGHVASRDVLGDAVVQHHVRGAAG